jgi:hypothetical protein
MLEFTFGLNKWASCSSPAQSPSCSSYSRPNYNNKILMKSNFFILI